MTQRNQCQAPHPEGLLAINKPRGMVSKDVSRLLKRRFGVSKLGHAGTLDPIASGILPVLLGSATKLQDYLVDFPKEYEFDVTFGAATDTGDTDGTVISEKPWDHLTQSRLEELCASLVGEQWQIPPIYSAVKFRGQALYKYARNGKTDLVPLDSLGRKIDVNSLELLAFSGPVATFRLGCSKGTYVRSIATKLAELSDTFGAVSRLVRTRASGLALADTMDVAELEALEGPLTERIVPIDQMILPIPKWRAEQHQYQRLRQGQSVTLDGLGGFFQAEAKAPGEVGTLLILDERGTAIGLGQFRFMNEKVSVSLKRGFV